MKPAVALRTRSHGADIAAQSRERAVADIVTRLRPYKRGVDQVAMREDIRVIVEVIVPLVAATPPYTAAFRRRAARAAKALAALEPDIPAFPKLPALPGFGEGQTGVTIFDEVRMVLKAIAFGTGPDPRFSYLNRICVHQAHVLLKKYSPQRPVTRRGGNVHMIARLIREAATGQPGTPAGLLKSIKQSKRDSAAFESNMRNLAKSLLRAPEGSK
jgi:hypothetical protein